MAREEVAGRCWRTWTASLAVDCRPSKHSQSSFVVSITSCRATERGDRCDTNAESTEAGSAATRRFPYVEKRIRQGPE